MACAQKRAKFGLNNILVSISTLFPQPASLTASVIGNFAGFSDWRIATRASREGPGEGDDKTSADGCDRVRHMPFGADRRRLGVGNRREGQIPRRAGCKAVLRGKGAAFGDQEAVGGDTECGVVV